MAKGKRTSTSAGASRDEPWVLSDSESEPDLSLDIYSIRSKPIPLNQRNNLDLNPSSSPSSSNTNIKSKPALSRPGSSSSSRLNSSGSQTRGLRQPSPINAAASSSSANMAQALQPQVNTAGFGRLSTFKTFVVGTSFYPEGSADAGEAITFTRQFSNPHDANAIEVRARGQKLGHLGRDEARKFAPLMDAGKIVLEGYMMDRCAGGSGKPKLVMDILGADKPALEAPLRFTTVSWSGFSELTANQPNAKEVAEGAPAVRAAAVARERARVKPEPAASQVAPASTAPAVAAAPVPAQDYNVTLVTYHCYLSSAQHAGVIVPAGSPLNIQRNSAPYYGSTINVTTSGVRPETCGTIPREAAAKLAPLLDQQKIQLEAYAKAGVTSTTTYRGVDVVMDIKCRATDYESLKDPLAYFFALSNGVGANIKASVLAASFARNAAAQAPALQLQPQGQANAQADPAGGRENAWMDPMLNARPAGVQLDLDLMNARAAAALHLHRHDPDDDLQEEDEGPDPGAGAAPAAGVIDELVGILNQMQAGNVRGEDALTSLYGEEGAVELAELPLHPNPNNWLEHGVTADLRSHQSQGVAWMQRAEHRPTPMVGEKQNCLWHAKNKKGGGIFWRNIASSQHDGFLLKSRHAPVLMKGGILADAMGLGKTLTVIALALSDSRALDVKAEDKQRAEDKKKAEEDKKNEIEAAKNQGKGKAKAKPSKAKASSSSSAALDSEVTAGDVKPASQDLKKAALASTPSSTNGSNIKKRGLILPTPPPPGLDEDSQTEDEADVKPKINQKKKKTASVDMDGGSDEDAKPDISNSKKSTKKSISLRFYSDFEEDIKPTIGSNANSKAKRVDTDEEEDVKPQLKGKGKGKARQVEEEEEEQDVKVKVKGKSSIKKPAQKKKKVEVEEEEEDEDMDEDEEVDEWSDSNLIVCPLSVLQNWENQITEHCDSLLVNYVVYYGKSVAKLRHSDLTKFKFVLTTYDQIKSEHKFTTAKNALKTEELRHTDAMYELEEELEAAEESLLGASSTGALEEHQAAKQAALNAISLANQLHQRNIADAISNKNKKGKGKGKAKGKKKEETLSEVEDDLSTDEEAGPRAKKNKRKEEEMRESGLFTTKWRRVILDEAHIIRNHKTVVFRAAADIQAERRWCCTGTPIVNKTADLGSLCHFLGMAPFEDSKLWNKLIELPIKKKKNRAFLLLKNVVSTTVLRRTKNMTTEDGRRLIDLPPIEKYHHTIELDPETRKFYDDVEGAVRTRVTGWSEDGELNRNAGIMLVFLMRLRQICNDRSLLPANFLDDVQHRNFEEPIHDAGSKLTAEQISVLEDKLRAMLDAGDDCPVCFEALADKEPRITICSHAFCKSCIEDVIKTNPKCPMDRFAITLGSLIELPAEVVKGEGEATSEPEQAPEDRSAKAIQLIDLLSAIHNGDPQRKSLVFSSYTSYLDKLAVRLRKEGIPICRFDGRMNKPRRDAVLESFKRPLPSAQPRATAVETSASASTSTGGGGLLDQLRNEEQAGRFHHPPAGATITRKTASIPKANKRAEKERLQRDLDGAGLEIPRVMLISMGSGSVGLNLTAASNVFLMDPHWNTALEDQAIDRCHRIGQEKDVKVFHIIAANTVEQRVLDIQASKENLVMEAFRGVRNRGAAIEEERIRRETNAAGRTRVEDLVALFGLDPATLRRRHPNNFIRN